MPQIAKNVYGCKVIGSAGGPEKCALVTGKFGFDACIDYKSVSTAEELGAALKAHAPEGIDMYFEVRWGCTFPAPAEWVGSDTSPQLHGLHQQQHSYHHP